MPSLFLPYYTTICKILYSILSYLMSFQFDFNFCNCANFNRLPVHIILRWAQLTKKLALPTAIPIIKNLALLTLICYFALFD